MATKSQWCIDNGFNPGRGRPTKEKAAAMAAFVAGGGVWDDAAPAAPAKVTNAAPAAPKVTKVERKATDVIEVAERLWPEDIVYKDESGKVVSESAVCINCRPYPRSMPWCTCTRPVALGSVSESRIWRYLNGREYSIYAL